MNAHSERCPSCLRDTENDKYGQCCYCSAPRRRQPITQTRVARNRESARLARRQAVDAAARRRQKAEGACIAYIDSPRYDGWGYGLQGLIAEADGARLTLRDALAAPKPWVSGGQRPQPVRHTRAQRRRGLGPWGCWCRRCVRYLDAALPF